MKFNQDEMNFLRK